jgi:hypothetical protein
VTAANADQLDRVDFDRPGTDPVAAALLDLRSRPEPDRNRDVSGQNVVAQLAAELHADYQRRGLINLHAVIRLDRAPCPAIARTRCGALRGGSMWSRGSGRSA